ncbi:hypothetical protein DXG03_006794 [Asterophora parasitica]|uniref:Uncharacterized protein n=1 Tax=Asterophora parasitica TaxID=117018 RepID=A0A9P7G9C6_9AGAR|nr:hypothetical protein DXG03_006794 [Asterophora parasitica]
MSSSVSVDGLSVTAYVAGDVFRDLRAYSSSILFDAWADYGAEIFLCLRPGHAQENGVERNVLGDNCGNLGTGYGGVVSDDDGDPSESSSWNAIGSGGDANEVRRDMWANGVDCGTWANKVDCTWVNEVDCDVSVNEADRDMSANKVDMSVNDDVGRNNDLCRHRANSVEDVHICRKNVSEVDRADPSSQQGHQGQQVLEAALADVRSSVPLEE